MDKNIVDYGMCADQFLEGLIRLVNSMIKDGYQPYGYPFDGRGCIIQAMVKYED